MTATASHRRFALATGAGIAALLLAIGVVTVVGEVTGADARRNDEHAVPVAVAATYSATYTTEWQSPSNARLALDAHTDLLSRIAAAHGGGLRVVSTSSALRTRGDRGARLSEPLARFERTFELRLNARRDEPAVRAALTDAEVRLLEIPRQAPSPGGARVSEAADTASINSAVDR